MIYMTLNYTYRKNDGFFVGHFDDHPGHETQGRSLAELEAMLNDLYFDLELGKEPVLVRRNKLKLAEIPLDILAGVPA
jgi:predicted RNase H-like HicB family nuclease